MERSKETYIQTCREEAGGLKRKIMDLLGWTDLEYGECQYNNGLLYLDPYRKVNEHFVDQIEGNKMFWNWWKNHWTIRDEIFLKMMRLVNLNREELIHAYKEYHNGLYLQARIDINSIVLREAYAEMITDLIADETNKSYEH